MTTQSMVKDAAAAGKDPLRKDHPPCVSVDDEAGNGDGDGNDRIVCRSIMCSSSDEAAETPVTADVPLSPCIGSFSKEENGGALYENEEDWILEVFDLSDLLELDFQWNTSTTVRLWNLCVAVAAFLDFSAVMVRRFMPEGDNNEMELAAVRWLHENGTNLGIAFSFLWFVDSFVTANRIRIQKSRSLDRQRLLEKSEEEVLEEEDWWDGAWGVFVITITIQILLLPVGFFVFCFTVYKRAIGEIHDEDEVITVIHRTPDVDAPDELEIFTTHANVSLGFALLKYMIMEVSYWTGRYLKHQRTLTIHAIVRRSLRRALRNPFKFRREIKDILRITRWAKYLAPLLGALAKLRGNLVELTKRYRQYRAAYLARLLRKQRWEKLSPDELREHCAIRIQAAFRAHQARKHLHALELLQGEKALIAALKLQSAFRSALHRARARVQRKCTELKELQTKEQEMKKKNSNERLNVVDRRRLYQLQEELNNEAKRLLNKKLLLKPNTTFSVTWKVVCVVAVLFDIANLATKPFILKHYGRHERKTWSMESFLEHTLVPTPVTELKACMDKSEPEEGPRVLRALRKLTRKMRRQSSPEVVPPPWYCDQHYVTAQSLYIAVLEFVIQRFVAIIGVVWFLDVFVNFFTGQYNPSTGSLEPKPFFQRWFIPGLCLQLLVNPHMEATSEVVENTIRGMARRGPFRVLRWVVALFYPAYLLIANRVKRLWHGVVVRQNSKVDATPFEKSLSSRELHP